MIYRIRFLPIYDISELSADFMDIGINIRYTNEVMQYIINIMMNMYFSHPC